MKTTILSVLALFFTAQAFAGLSDQEFEAKYCKGNCVKAISMNYDPSGPLSAVEQYVIEKYTERNTILDTDLMSRAVSRIPTTSMTAYRGTSTRNGISRVGQIITIKGLTSISASKDVAQGFIKDQLLIIKTKSAHDISHYSVVGEQESILLPGVQLRVDKISTEEMDLGYQESNIVTVQVVELTEL